MVGLVLDWIEKLVWMRSVGCRSCRGRLRIPLPLDHFFFCFLPPVAAGAMVAVMECRRWVVDGSGVVDGMAVVNSLQCGTPGLAKGFPDGSRALPRARESSSRNVKQQVYDSKQNTNCWYHRGRFLLLQPQQQCENE